MKIEKLRSRVFYLLVGGKLLTIGWMLLLWVGKSYTVVQAREILLLISPLFVANITLGINYWAKKVDQSTVEEGSMPPAFQFSTFAFLIAYIVFVIAMMTYYATLSGDEASFAALKDWIGFAELVFGGFVGLTFSHLFVGKG